MNLTLDLFELKARTVVMETGANLLRGFAESRGIELLASIEDICRVSPFRHMMTLGGPMSVAMTNCGPAGWVTDRTGYRYTSIDPETGQSWPAMPQLFKDLSTQAAQSVGFSGFAPDACLVNRYEGGTRLSLHQDKNERDFSQPIVSVSLGLPAIFLWGGNKRTDRPRRISLFHGDVVVWGGPARMIYHGVNQLAQGNHSLTDRFRYNLTFRRAL